MHGEGTGGEGRTEDTRVREGEAKEGSGAAASKKPSNKLLSKLGLPAQTSSTTTLTQKLNVNRPSPASTSQAPPSLAALLGVNKRPNQKAQSPAPSQNNKAAMCKPWSLVVKDPLWASSASTTATPPAAQPPSSAGGTPENTVPEIVGNPTTGERDVTSAVGPTLNEAALAARREKKQAPPFGALETPSSLRLSDSVSGRVGDLLDIEESRRGWKGAARSQTASSTTAFGTNRLTAAAAAISAFTPNGLFPSGGNAIFKTPSTWAPFPSKKTSQGGGGEAEAATAGGDAGDQAPPKAPADQSSSVPHDLPLFSRDRSNTQDDNTAASGNESKGSGDVDVDCEPLKPPSNNPLLVNSTDSASSKDTAPAPAPSSNRWLAAGSFLGGGGGAGVSHSNPAPRKMGGGPSRQASTAGASRGPHREEPPPPYAQAGRYVPPSMRNKMTIGNGTMRKAEDPSRSIESSTGEERPKAESRIFEAPVPALHQESQHLELTSATRNEGVGKTTSREKDLFPDRNITDHEGNEDDEVPPPPFSPPPVVSFHSQSAAPPALERRASVETPSPSPPVLKGSAAAVYESFEVAMDGWPRWMDAALNHAPASKADHPSLGLPPQTSLKTMAGDGLGQGGSGSAAAAAGGGGGGGADWRHQQDDTPHKQRLFAQGDGGSGLYGPVARNPPPHFRQRLSSSESGGGAHAGAVMLNHAGTIHEGVDVPYPTQQNSTPQHSAAPHQVATDMPHLVLPVCQVHPGLTAWASRRVQPPMTLQSPASSPPSAEFDIETTMHVSAGPQASSYNPRADALRYRQFMDTLPSATATPQLLQSTARSTSRMYEQPGTNNIPPESSATHGAGGGAAASRQGDGGGGLSRRASPPSLLFGSSAAPFQPFARQSCFFPNTPQQQQEQQQASLRHADGGPETSLPMQQHSCYAQTGDHTSNNSHHHHHHSNTRFRPELSRSTWDPPDNSSTSNTAGGGGAGQFETTRRSRYDDPANSPPHNGSSLSAAPQAASSQSVNSRLPAAKVSNDKSRYKANKRGSTATVRGPVPSAVPARTTLASTAAAIAQLNKSHKTSAVPIGAADPTP